MSGYSNKSVFIFGIKKGNMYLKTFISFTVSVLKFIFLKSDSFLSYENDEL